MRPQAAAQVPVQVRSHNSLAAGPVAWGAGSANSNGSCGRQATRVFFSGAKPILEELSLYFKSEGYFPPAAARP